jgi:hypothetical protein
MIVDVCGSCGRATKEKDGKDVYAYSPKKVRLGWDCEYLLPKKEKL